MLTNLRDIIPNTKKKRQKKRPKVPPNVSFRSGEGTSFCLDCPASPGLFKVMVFYSEWGGGCV